MAELVHAKRNFLIGSLSGPNFPVRTAKMDRPRKDLTKSCLGKILEERPVLYEVETLFLLSCLYLGKNLCENDIMKIVCFLLSSL